MVRSRDKKERPAVVAARPSATQQPGLDVNAVVSYNVKAIRERRGWTQQSVAERLGRITGHQLPQASISAMERGFDGDRRRRFDAHELYLLSVVFDVPIAYFFVPPPDPGVAELADTRRPVAELYVALLGRDGHLDEIDERLADLSLTNPEDVDDLAAAIFGAEGAARNWHTHFQTWRKQRIAELAKNYTDRLDEVAETLAEFALQVRQLSPKGYLEMMTHRGSENPENPEPADPADEEG